MKTTQLIVLLGAAGLFLWLMLRKEPPSVPVNRIVADPGVVVLPSGGIAARFTADMTRFTL